MATEGQTILEVNHAIISKIKKIYVIFAFSQVEGALFRVDRRLLPLLQEVKLCKGHRDGRVHFQSETIATILHIKHFYKKSQIFFTFTNRWNSFNFPLQIQTKKAGHIKSRGRNLTR